MSASSPEAQARSIIDKQLQQAGWIVQDRAEFNPAAGTGIAVREFPLHTGFADYLLLVDRKAVGAVEAKKVGTPLSGVEAQSAKYSAGLPEIPPAWRKPLPFLYESTGVETFFTNGLDPDPRSRRVFSFHRPETLRQWVTAGESLRSRLLYLPPLTPKGLWPAQIEAIQNLEASLAADRPRALIQMATGSGKTFTAVNFTYRLIAHANAQRVLFLVDRGNLGRQAHKEFQQFVTPDDGRKFTELYNVQHLQSNALDRVSRVCITTIQRLYSMLSGEPEYDVANEEGSLFEAGDLLTTQPPKQVIYNPALPPETFDVVVIDECHRSIYNLWRQVVEYFDAYLIGLTATPALHTFGFFHKNLVMEYSRKRAVADGVNVDGDVYRIRTRITEEGSQIDAGFAVEKRDTLTRARRWEQLDEDLTYGAGDLDRSVVSEDQIRTVIRAFRDRLFTEIFPGRREVPKTLIFAKDDSHAEDIVRIVREEFGKGNDFCKKITYRVSGVKPEDLIQDFRISYHPRIAVTVDMIATGTDVKPLEIVFFMRSVKSRVLFEQMLGRGTRVIDPTDLQQATPDAERKDHFVIVDAVGVVDRPKFDAQSLERKRSVSFDRLLESVAWGAHDVDTLSSLAGRLARLDKHLDEKERVEIRAASGGKSLKTLVNRLLDALDPDRAWERASTLYPDLDEAEIDGAVMAETSADLRQQAVEPLVINPALRNLLVDLQQRRQQVIDTVSLDQVLEAGFSAQATGSAQEMVASFRQFIEDHVDEITALQVIYSQPYSQRRVTDEQIQDLAERLRQPPHSWTTESLWRAYAQLEKDRVRDASGRRVLSDLVSLVRHALQLDDELVPYPQRVQQRYALWLAAQEAGGKRFSDEQRWWLDKIAEHVGVNLDIRPDDLSGGEFYRRGGFVAARQIFGGEVNSILAELNTALAVT
jgi:type I restriction enzyme R subunit